MSQSRREIIVFLILTVTLSSFFYGYLLLAAAPLWNSPVAWGFMWCPGVAALVTKMAFRRPLAELGWRWGPTRRYLAGVVLLPVLCAFAVYALVWLTGLGRFSLERLSAIPAFSESTTPKTAYLVLALVAVAPLRIAVGSLAALGEELGWRGLLAPELLKLTTPARTSLVTGLVWSVWHYPLVYVLLPRFRPGLPRWYALTCFTLTVVGISFVYTWIRLRSGSVWPAVFLHSASATAQEMLEALTQDAGRTHYLTYEYGVGFTVVVALILAGFWRTLTAFRQSAQPEASELPTLPTA